MSFLHDVTVKKNWIYFTLFYETTTGGVAVLVAEFISQKAKYV